MGLLEKNNRSKCKSRQKLTAYHCVGLLEKGDPYQTQDHLNHGIRGMLDPNPKCRKHLKIMVIRPDYNIWKHSIAGISILWIKTSSPNKLEMHLNNIEKNTQNIFIQCPILHNLYPTQAIYGQNKS